MPRLPLLLDTDILSAVLKSNPRVSAAAAEYLEEYGHFTISAITRFEILRGLRARNALVQAKAFDTFCAAALILPVTDAVIVKGAEIYGELYGQGRLISDADILIAATALVHGLGVATNNEEHFRRVPELRIENWLR